MDRIGLMESKSFARSRPHQLESAGLDVCTELSFFAAQECVITKLHCSPEAVAVVIQPKYIINAFMFFMRSKVKYFFFLFPRAQGCDSIEKNHHHTNN